MKSDIPIKRVYEPPSSRDGARILVDRVWPRGMTKEAAALTSWLKEIAPSPALRKWFGHDPARWSEFQRRYRLELDRNPDAVGELRDLLAKKRGTLIYGARDPVHNQARVLADYIGHSRGAPRRRPAKHSSEKPS